MTRGGGGNEAAAEVDESLGVVAVGPKISLKSKS